VSIPGFSFLVGPISAFLGVVVQQAINISDQAIPWVRQHLGSASTFNAHDWLVQKFPITALRDFPGVSAAALASGGGLGDLLKGGLGGLLAGGAAGSVLSGGLNDLLKQFQQSGQSETVNSWVGTGPNKQISPNDLGGALGSDRINALVEQTGMSRDELLRSLSQYLPQVVDQLTPHGRVPTEQEVHRLL